MKAYDNFAFISYSRTDMKAATFIQSSLEHFRYPRDSIRPEFLPADTQFVREIFLDKTKLSGRGASFEQNLENALAKSRYLIVLCSPDAAKLKENPIERHYVEWEINTFLRHHGGDPSKPDDPEERRKTEQAKNRIIPVIVRGEPNLSDSSCLPRPIRTSEFCKRNLPDMRPVRGQKMGFFRRRNTWHSAIVTLLSYVFDVERSIIFDRFTAERARARLKIGIAASVAAAIILGIGCLAAYERSRKLDAASWRHFSIAQNHLENANAANAFGKSDLALPHLSLAARIPAAREYLVNQLLQRSWIVPFSSRQRANDPNCQSEFATCKIESMSDLEHMLEVSRRIDYPSDFPLVFTNDSGRIAAIAKNGAQRAWMADEYFNVYQARLSPVGTLLATLRHQPSPSIDGVDPYTGQIIWTKKLSSPLRDFKFSADGRRLAILSFTGKLTILRAMTGEREFETLHIGSDAQQVRFTGDGQELVIEKPSQTVTCKLVKQLLEFPLSVRGLPIVNSAIAKDGTTFQLTAKCPSGGFATTWDSKTLSMLETRELQGNEVSCEYLSNKTTETRRTATGRKVVAASGSNITAKTTDDNCVQLFDKKTQRPVSEPFEMPSTINHLNFIALGKRNYLLIGGGAFALHNADAQGFYAIIDVETRTLLHLRAGMEGQITASFQLADTQCLLHGTNNTRDWIITLPPPESPSMSQAEFKHLCRILSGNEMSADEVPIPRLTLAKDMPSVGISRAFLTECQSSPSDRHTSFITATPMTSAVNQLANGRLDDLNTVLDFQPNNPEALANYWIPYSQDSIKSEFARAHPEMSHYQVELHFCAFTSRQWVTTIGEDRKSVYFADRITSYSLTCNPSSDVARKNRHVFLVLSGMEKPPKQTADDRLQKWRDFISNPQNDILTVPELANDVAAEFCSDRESFSSFLSQLRSAISTSLTAKDLDFDRVVAAAAIVSDISAWAMDVNDCDVIFRDFLKDLAADAQKAKSTIFADNLRSQLLLLALEKSIRIGDGQQAISIRNQIDAIVNPDITTQHMLSFFDIFIPLCMGKAAECKNRYEATKAKDRILFTAMEKGIWDLLSEMRLHSVDLGALAPEYERLSAQHSVGVQIRVIPGEAAEGLGWKNGDAIKEIDGHPITDDKALNAILTVRRRQNSGRPAKFTLIRDGSTFESETDKTTLGIQF